MNTEFTLTQKRALAILTLIALLFGAYFLRNYFVLIVVAAVGAYLFTPLFKWFTKRFNTGLSAACTLLSALAAVVVPVGALVGLAIVQIARMVDSVADWVRTTDLSTLGDKILQFVNGLFDRVPFLHITVTADALRKAMISVAQNVGEWLLHFLRDAAGSLAGVITSAIIFVYVFVALLVNREKLRTLIGQLNPLGEDVTDLYLQKMGSMVRGTVNGQFVIAACQGVAGAASIYIAGFHHGFFIFAIVLTALSIIPLGGGIVTIPFGIGMIFYGNIAGGNLRAAVASAGGYQHRQRPAADPGAARRAAELGADVAVGVRRYHHVRPLGYHHRPGADDPHRHHHRRLPRGVQRRRTGTVRSTTRPPQVAAASRPGHVKKRPASVNR